MCELGKITEVPLREEWRDEARNFTQWLERNIEILGKALKLELEVIGREVPVGGFSLDLLVKALDTDEIGVIENQYGQTDHDHFGKLLTYAGGQEARIVVWISEHVREEHREALDWLNRTSTETQFFAVELNLVRIDDSRPAPLFRPVVFPNEWLRNTRRITSTNVSPRNEKYRSYFQCLIDELDGIGHAPARPGSAYWLPAGITNIRFRLSFRTNNRVCSSLWIFYKGDAEQNLMIFDALMERRSEIESTFGDGLIWNRQENRTTHEISVCRDGNIDMPENELEGIRDWHIGTLQRLKAAFGPELRRAVDAVEDE